MTTTTEQLAAALREALDRLDDDVSMRAIGVRDRGEAALARYDAEREAAAPHPATLDTRATFLALVYDHCDERDRWGELDNEGDGATFDERERQQEDARELMEEIATTCARVLGLECDKPEHYGELLEWMADNWPDWSWITDPQWSRQRDDADDTRSNGPRT